MVMFLSYSIYLFRILLVFYRYYVEILYRCVYIDAIYNSYIVGLILGFYKRLKICDVYLRWILFFLKTLRKNEFMLFVGRK